MLNPKIQITADGSHTLYLPNMEEHYHSVNGAIRESLHVYIQAGLKHCKKDEINILELGFGTGLNAFLSFVESQNRNLKINYTTIEKFPLSPEIIRQLNYTAGLLSEFKDSFETIHNCEWGNFISVANNFRIKKIHADFSEVTFNDYYDVIFYDAFAPDKQSEVWSQEIFNKLFEHSKPNGILTTYCAKGSIRRMMQSAGFHTERIPGPPGKREMLRAIKAS